MRESERASEREREREREREKEREKEREESGREERESESHNFKHTEIEDMKAGADRGRHTTLKLTQTGMKTWRSGKIARD